MCGVRLLGRGAKRIRQGVSMALERRYNNINILRFVAALMVLGGHLSTQLAISPIPFIGDTSNAIGVKIFFLLGGYLITKSWRSDPHPLRYAVKRGLRIWPALAVCTLLAVFVAGPLLTTLSLQEYFAGGAFLYLRNLRLDIVFSLPGVFAGNPLPYEFNGSLWSLPVEVAMYLLVPLLCLILDRIPSPRVQRFAAGGIAVAACLLEMLRARFFPTWTQMVYSIELSQLSVLLPYYMIGLFFAYAEPRKYLNVQTAAVLLLAAPMLQYGLFTARLASFIVLSYAVYALAFCPQPQFGQAFEKAEISYGMYLYGFPIQQAVIYLLGRSGVATHYMLCFVLSTALTMVAAWLSYRFVEKPALDLSKKLVVRLKKKAPAQTV